MFFKSILAKQLTITAIFCLLALSALSCGKSANTIPSFKLKDTAFNGIAEKMYSPAPKAQWTVPADSKSEDDFLIELKSSILTGIDKYSHINEVRVLKDYYGTDLSVGVLDRDPEKSRYLDNYSAGKIVVLAYPKAARDEKAIPTLIGYFPKTNGDGVISMPGFRSPDMTWFNARFLHELYHQHQHDTEQPGALADPKTDEWVTEEVKAHELASTILNSGTKGRYFDLLSEIVTRYDRGTIEKMLAEVKLEDVQRIDSLFAPAKQEEINNRLPQYYLDLCFAWLRIRHSGQDLLKNQLVVYRSLK